MLSFGSVSAIKSKPNATPATTVAVEALPVHDIEIDQERRGRSLKHLLKANHVNYAVVYKNLQLNNVNSHNLSTAYILGANENDLNTIYNEQIKDLEPWTPSPAEVIDEDWRDFLGNRNYQRAFVDYYEDKLAFKFAYDWKQEMRHVLTEGDEPLINCLIGAFGHPLEHLALACEINSRALAMEALSLTCIHYNELHKYLDEPSYTKPSTLPCSSLSQLISRLAKGGSSPVTVTADKHDSLESLFSQHQELILDYWNAWHIVDATKQFEELQQIAVALFASSGLKSFSFLAAQILSASNSIRILLPYIPAEYHVSLLRQWWLLAIAVCLLTGRPEPNSANVQKDASGRTWKHVIDKAINGPYLADASYMKAVRAIKEASSTWGDADNLYLRSALTFLKLPVIPVRETTLSIFSTQQPQQRRNLPLNHAELPARPADANLTVMAPPAKRRRRNTVDSADEHDDDADHQPSRANTLNNFLLASPSSPSKSRIATASPSPSKGRGVASKNGTSPRKSSLSKNGAGPSPRKSRDAGRGGSDEKGKSGDLKLLFSKQAQRASKAPSAAGGDNRTLSVDDIVSDPISEDDEISDLKASSSSLVGQHARKRQRVYSQQAPLDATTSSQRFMKPPRPTNADDDDLRPWSERYGPRNLDELAVHKKKVADVRRWLEEVIGGRLRQRLLILKGAAGSGKTTTVRLLAKEMGCELLEWRNPVGNAGTGFVSSSAQFQDFLGRGGKFGALDLDSPSSTSTASSNANTDNDKRIMLIEEFPNTFSRSSSTLSSFRGALLQFLSNHVPSLSVFSQYGRREPVKPVILVISETLLTTTSASADSLTAHRLLGPEILGHPGVGVIEFNAIAPSLLAKALELVVLKEARKSGRRRTPGPMVLKRLGEIGDVRSAISSLEFLCLKGDQVADWGAKVAFTKQKKSTKDGIGMTQGEQDSLELVSQREASLGIFHAVGKVVYNKREENASGDEAETLPHYLSQHSRPRKSQISVDTLIGETGTDTHTFIAALHENYILSCESTGPMDLSTPMDYVNECIEHLSLSDLMCPSQDVFFGGRGGFTGRDSGSHVLRQDEMMFEVAVRGMLFSLPNPVKRKTSGMARSSDAFKMFYPASLKLWRAKEEIGGLVDMWSSRMLRGEDQVTRKEMTAGANAFRRNPRLTASAAQSSQAPPTKRQGSSAEDDDGQTAMLSLGSAARRELLLERLPYTALIARARKSGPRTRELEKIVSLSGIPGSNEEEEDADEEGGAAMGEAWATDKPSEEASPRKKRQGIKSGAVTSMLAQKLVLSDDDIED
ncbi:hypothetical protein MY4038_006261 [Beauveria bassiana]